MSNVNTGEYYYDRSVPVPYFQRSDRCEKYGEWKTWVHLANNTLIKLFKFVEASQSRWPQTLPQWHIGYHPSNRAVLCSSAIIYVFLFLHTPVFLKRFCPWPKTVNATDLEIQRAPTGILAITEAISFARFFRDSTFQILVATLLYGGWDSSVGTATRYRLNGPGIESRWGRDFPHPSRLTTWPTQPPTQ